MSQKSKPQLTEVDKAQLPDNTVTVVIKLNGKMYSTGAKLGDIKPEMADEDLDSTLRAIRGLGITAARTIAMQGAGRGEDYEIPLTDLEREV